MNALNSSACLVLCVANALCNSVTVSCCFIWEWETVASYASISFVVCKYLYLYIILTFSDCIVCLLLDTTSGSVVLTQTHPTAPYVCRTGNITLRCQYGIAEEVLWRIDSMFDLVNPSTIPGHTALLRTTSYHDLVVDSYTNLRGEYRCTAVFGNGMRAGSNVYLPNAECE